MALWCVLELNALPQRSQLPVCNNAAQEWNFSVIHTFRLQMSHYLSIVDGYNVEFKYTAHKWPRNRDTAQSVAKQKRRVSLRYPQPGVC